MSYFRFFESITFVNRNALRSRFYPDVPTIAETYPGFESESWVAMFAPAATPRPVLERLYAAMAKIVADRDMRARFDAQGCDVVGDTPEALAGLVRREQAKWGRVIREKNITVE